MTSWQNDSGRPLSSSDWLLIHHTAKLFERRQFAQELSRLNPKRIVDLGCGVGLWLDLLDKVITSNCEFIGIDSDASAIGKANERALSWRRPYSLVCADLEDIGHIPDSDLMLAFNIFPYIGNPSSFLQALRGRISPGGHVVVRQYDAGTMRFGPMDNLLRQEMENSLFCGVHTSSMFRHYDIDRTCEHIYASGFLNKKVTFELFSKTSPYDDQLLRYIRETIDWNMQFISEDAAIALNDWKEKHLIQPQARHSYFTEVDMVAWLS